MRASPLLLAMLLACASNVTERARTGEPARAAAEVLGPVLESVADALSAGDLPRARALLERGRWLAEDRARAALLYCGVLLAQRDHAAAADVLREYLAKTTRLRTARDALVVKLLRHHASGGGLRAADAEEACYFGLYALCALGEEQTAGPDLEWALREAPEPERALVRAAWSPGE